MNTVHDEMIYGSENVDYVRCNDCFWKGGVHASTEACPACGHVGGLMTVSEGVGSLHICPEGIIHDCPLTETI